MNSTFYELEGMKVLITGVGGFMGSRIAYEIPDAIPSPSLRGADEKAIRHITEDIDVIIHTSAISDVSLCEKYPDESYQANVELPVMLARTGKKLITFSSGQVYSGSSDEGPYTETDAKPVSLYGKQKLEMEERVLDINPDAIMLRATWMYDMPMYGVSNRGNFFVNMLRASELSFSSTQRWAVTYAREAAGNVRKAIALPGGAYNFGSENNLTMLETAQWLKDRLRLSVKLSDAGMLHNLWMDCSKLRSYGIRFQSTLDGLSQCILDYGL